MLRRFVLALSFLLLHACRSPITHGSADLPNFQQVSSSLFRGGQPTPAGFHQLAQRNIRTIVNVRLDDDDSPLLRDLSFTYRFRPLSEWSISDDDVIWFLSITADHRLAPVFLHCQHGSDRTGCLVAMYRIVIQNWSRDDAISEMTAPGNGFHPLMGHLISYIRNADIRKIRAALPCTFVAESPSRIDAAWN